MTPTDRQAEIAPDGRRSVRVDAVRRLAPTILTMAGVLGPVSAQILNGSFEQQTCVSGVVSTSTGRLPGDQCITGWRVSTTPNGGVNLVGGTWAASAGANSIELAGSSNGGIEQTCTTVADRRYSVRFSLAGEPGGSSNIKNMRVEVDNGQFQDFAFDTVAGTPSNLGWVRQEWSFCASGPSTTLKFSSTDAGTSHGAAIDDVSIVESTDCQLTTLFGSNNAGSAGWSQFFDVQLTCPITVLAFDINANGSVGTVGTVDMWITPLGGTHVGNETNPATPWLLASTGVATTSAASNSPTTVCLNTPVILAAGTYGIALYYTGFGMAYTNGSQSFTSGPMTLTAGSSSTDAPGTVGASLFTPRTWNGTIYWDKFLKTESFGNGCASQSTTGYGKCYERFDGINNVFDMAPNADAWIGDRSSSLDYTLLPASYPCLVPSFAMPIPFGDDDTQAIALPVPMPTPAGNITEIFVCSNGWISFEPTTSTDFSETVAEFCANENRICPLWDDLNPAAGGAIGAGPNSNNPTEFCVTWAEVPEFGTMNTNTFQVCFDLTTGSFRVCYGTVDSRDSIIGYTGGHGGPDPGSRDFNGGGLPFAIGQASVRGPLELEPDRPLTAGLVNFTIRELPVNAPLAAVIVSFNCFEPPIPLDFIGMPGCVLTGDGSAGAIWVQPTGRSTATFGLNVAGAPNGLLFCLQALVATPGSNAPGSTSNGLKCTVVLE